MRSSAPRRRSLRPADNPFRSERIDALEYRLRGEDWSSALARLAALQHRATVVGPHGYGKTTLLDALARRLREQGHDVVRARVDATWTPPVDPRGRTFLLDGTETLGAWRSRRLLARLGSARGVIASRHEPGWLPTWIRCETDPGLLAELYAELVGENEACVDLDALWLRHSGNLRACLLELYATFAMR